MRRIVRKKFAHIYNLDDENNDVQKFHPIHPRFTYDEASTRIKLNPNTLAGPPSCSFMPESGH